MDHPTGNLKSTTRSYADPKSKQHESFKHPGANIESSLVVTVLVTVTTTVVVIADDEILDPLPHFLLPALHDPGQIDKDTGEPRQVQKSTIQPQEVVYSP